MKTPTRPPSPPPGNWGRRPGRLAPERSGSGSHPHPLRDWCLFLLSVLGKVYRALLLTLVAIAVAPMAWHWSTYVVRSGSMEPAISTGDVVIGQPFGSAEKVPVGRVMFIRIAEGPAGGTTRVHRVVDRRPDGDFVTAGDANASNDPDPVQRRQFIARAVIRVPFVGLPQIWFAERDLARLAAWSAITSLLLAVSFRSGDGGTGARRRSRGPGHGAPAGRSRVRRVTGGSLFLAAVILISNAPGTASAAFTAVTASRGNTWHVTSSLQPYAAAVIADKPYAYYRVEEASGATAADSSGFSRTGSYTAVSGYHQAGALPGNPGFAIGLNGSSGRLVGGGPATSDPTTFSAELWFRTTTNAGGKLIGFENTQGTASTAYDRVAFMRTDGRVVYVGGVQSGKLLVSTRALNDGAWHHLVVTASPQGSQEATVLYIDGLAVDSGTTAQAPAGQTGWWRAGFGRVPTGTGYPLTGNFTGSLDEIAVYQTRLTATRVALHYAAR